MLVSVIIPCFNCERFINETIQSVLVQTHQEFEIICVDNGSTDLTTSIIQQLADSNTKIRLYQENRRGASYARSTGLEYTKGEFIQFLDSDDIILPKKFEEQIRFLTDNHLDWVISDRSVMNEGLMDVLEKHTFEDFESGSLDTVIGKIITSGNPLYKADCVKAVEGYTRELPVAQDWEFHLKLFLSGAKVKYLPGDFFHSRTVTGSLSSNWFSVSKTLCVLILQYKPVLTERSDEMKHLSAQRILNVYFTSFVHLRSREKANEYLSELQFWGDHFKNHEGLSGLNRILEKFIGIRSAAKLKRLISKKID